MKKANKKVDAAIIIIGNEILSGRTQDVNVVSISKWLNKLGVRLEEVRVIPDTEDIIVKTINDVKKKFNYVFTTGGIGPTHDDITSRSIARAFNLSYGYHKEAYKILETYYGAENFNKGRKKMSMLPDKALLIFNPSSGAPGFIVDNVYSLPGVPSILKSMLGGLNSKIKGGKKIFNKTITLMTVESEIATSLEKVQNNFKDVEIGSYPFFKAGKVGVSIVMRNEEQSKIDICNSQILEFVNQKNIQIISEN